MKKYSLLTLISIFLMFLILFAQDDTKSDKDTILFSHEFHVQEQELECTDCHDAKTSTTGKDNLIPDMEVCADCHDVDDEANCKQCHSNVENAGNTEHITNYSQLFSHEKHINANIECATCHGDVTGIVIGKFLPIPDMIKCMSCHQNKQVSVECSTCHAPGERLKPVSHDLAFLRTHGKLAGNFDADVNMGKNCATCHKAEFCQDCHEGENVERFAHPLNFEFTHALYAQGRERNCYTCHEDREFCSSCHIAKFNIEPRNHQRANWATPPPGDGGQHRIEALIDLESCMSCHDQDADEKCQQCHPK